MPIKPENAARYPKHWRLIRQRILDRAGHKCERCGVPNHHYRNRKTGEVTSNAMQAESWACVDMEPTAYIVLTIMHLDHTPENCADENLQAACQRCHLAYDQAHHQRNAHATRRNRKAIGELI